MFVIENAIDPSLIHGVNANWPDESWRGWHRYRGKDSVKYGTRDAEMILRCAWPALYQIASVADRLAPPGSFPDWELSGAGMHMIPSGGHLSRHLDSDHMEATGWRRELSVVLFCNPEWEDDWGGAFSIDGESDVYPKFNQMVIFETTDTSAHEVRKVTGPEPRKTLSLFFWSTDPSAKKRPRAAFLDKLQNQPCR